MALKIEELYNNSSLKVEFAKNAKEKADECFDSIKQFEKLINLFKIFKYRKVKYRIKEIFEY